MKSQLTQQDVIRALLDTGNWKILAHPPGLPPMLTNDLPGWNHCYHCNDSYMEESFDFNRNCCVVCSRKMNKKYPSSKYRSRKKREQESGEADSIN
jgi:hypothetical protein